jgi:hypothetical protein
VHVLQAPIQVFVENAVKAMFHETKEAELVFAAGWKTANEAATEDISKTFLKTAGWGPVVLEPEDEDMVVESQPPAETQIESVKKDAE